MSVWMMILLAGGIWLLLGAFTLWDGKLRLLIALGVTFVVAVAVHILRP
jgi:hypothetical protein